MNLFKHEDKWWFSPVVGDLRTAYKQSSSNCPPEEGYLRHPDGALRSWKLHYECTGPVVTKSGNETIVSSCHDYKPVKRWARRFECNGDQQILFKELFYAL